MRQEFRSRHPDCTLLSVGVGEGDGDNAYVIFDMRCQDGVETRTEALFQKNDHAWKAQWEVPVPAQPGSTKGE
jgi:hypothetical protein